jgi:hypothetical protein
MIKLKDDKLMIEETELNAEEAHGFVFKFMVPEIDRHAELRDTAINMSDETIDQPALALAWSLSAMRHQQDIEFTWKAVRMLCEKFGFELPKKDWWNIEPR